MGTIFAILGYSIVCLVILAIVISTINDKIKEHNDYKKHLNEQKLQNNPDENKQKNIHALEHQPRKNDVFQDYIEKTINGRVLRFYPLPHKYTVDGKPVKTVTEVVKEWSIDNGFYEYGGVDPKVLMRAANKGIALHKEIENFELNGIVGQSEEFKNYLKIKKKHQFIPKENEIFVYICDDEGTPVCAGRLDFTMFLNKQFGLCDIKRTSTYHIHEVELQLNLYRLGYEQLFDAKIETLYCLRLREDVAEFNKVRLNAKLAKSVVKKYCNQKTTY